MSPNLSLMQLWKNEAFCFRGTELHCYAEAVESRRGTCDIPTGGSEEPLPPRHERVDGVWGAWGRPASSLSERCTWFLGQPAPCGPAAARERICPERQPRLPCGISSRPNCSLEVSLTPGTPSSGQKPRCPCQGMCQPRSSTPCFGNL